MEFHLDSFDGPLDLLLHLITRAKVDIKDIFVSEITEQYLASMGSVGELDMDTASEFLTMAATLLEIKSRALLPRPPEPAEDGEETQYWVYGKYVEIALDGDPGVRVRLTHCSELLVQPGDTVRAGQLVARVGSTGNSTGNHCHLELLADEYYTDPELILTRPEP